MVWQLLVTGVLAVAAPLKTDVVVKKYADGTPRVRTEVLIDPAGKAIPHGTETKYFPNGKPALEAHYVEGQLEGPWTAWHLNGTKSIDRQYHNNKRNGTEIRYLLDGAKFLEANYKDNVRDGKRIDWYDGKKKRREADYVNGLLEARALRMGLRWQAPPRRALRGRPEARALDDLARQRQEAVRRQLRPRSPRRPLRRMVRQRPGEVPLHVSRRSTRRQDAVVVFRRQEIPRR